MSPVLRGKEFSVGTVFSVFILETHEPQDKKKGGEGGTKKTKATH